MSVLAPLRRGGILTTGFFLGYTIGTAGGDWVLLLLTYALSWIVIEIVTLLTED